MSDEKKLYEVILRFEVELPEGELERRVTEARSKSLNPTIVHIDVLTDMVINYTCSGDHYDEIKTVSSSFKETKERAIF